MAPFIEGSGAIATGCLALLAAGLVFLGFILPWASFRFLFLLSGAFSGLSMLFQLVIGVLLALAGTASGGDLAGMSALAVVGLLVVAVFLVVIPYMGFRIGRTGLHLIQSPRLPRVNRRETSRQLIRLAGIGLVPTLCYLTTATTGLSGLGSLGLSVEALQGSIGLWLTLAGFTVAIIAGLVISTAVALAEQLSIPRMAGSPGISTPVAPVSPPAPVLED